MVGRLTQQMVKVIQADTTSLRGVRNVIDGEAELLTGFEFNINGKLGTSLFAPYTGAIDRTSGNITVDMSPFVPQKMIAAPSGTTHYKIISAGAEIDFEAETFVEAHIETAILPWDHVETVALNQLNSVTPNSTKPLFLALGVEYYQEVNGQMYPLNNGAYNPLALVKVDGQGCFGVINFISNENSFPNFSQTAFPTKSPLYSLINSFNVFPIKGPLDVFGFITFYIGNLPRFANVLGIESFI